MVDTALKLILKMFVLFDKFSVRRHCFLFLMSLLCHFVFLIKRNIYVCLFMYVYVNNNACLWDLPVKRCEQDFLSLTAWS